MNPEYIEQLIRKYGSVTSEPLLDLIINVVEDAVLEEREACLSILRDMEGKKWHTVIHGGEMKGVSLHDAYAAIRARGNSETL